MQIRDLHAEPDTANSLPKPEYGHVDMPFDHELVAMFAYLYANWTEFGGDEAIMKMWSYITANMKKVNYSIDGQRIEVEMGHAFGSMERMKYLMLPYLDVPIDEKVFIDGEIARTHHSAVNEIPGLFTTTGNYTTGYDFQPLTLGIQVCKFEAKEFMRSENRYKLLDVLIFNTL